MAMTLDQMREEMLRKPDAHLALEWIAMWGVEIKDVNAVTEAYFKGLESEVFDTTCIECGEAINDDRPYAPTSEGELVHEACVDLPPSVPVDAVIR